MAKSVKNLLDILLNTDNNWQLYLLRNWPTIVGNLHEKMRLEKIQDATLIIGVYDSHWMHELFALSRVILRTINSKLDAPHVQKLQFKLAKQKKSSKKAVQAPTPLVQQNTRALSSAQRQALTKINDTELQEHLKKLLERCII